jgi:hydroxymethylpyrimidine pyrophosphatase-like HAD family hydrolase
LATSPLDGKTAWIEIFPPDTSKGTALRWLAKHTGVDLSATIAIGNDYNDTDMLETVGTAYVVANAPDELKTRFRVTTSHDADGFSIAIRQAMQTVVRQFGMESCKSPSSPG